MPGGNNYAAKLFEDAAINYTYADDTTSGFLELSVESVLEKSKDADLWIGVADFESLSQLQASDNRYTFFQAFQNKQVYTYNALTGARGGSVFLELGYLRPDLILADLVQIAHPTAGVADSLYFHAKLPE
jgi:iron complex transport system substrate-binding protein